jgi:hypothetical protein
MGARNQACREELCGAIATKRMESKKARSAAGLHLLHTGLYCLKLGSILSLHCVNLGGG